MKGDSPDPAPSISELLVNGEKVTGVGNLKCAVKDFWENVGGVNEENNVRKKVEMQFEKKNMCDIDKEISKDEIRRYVRKLKNGKASGADGIPYEMFKNGGEAVIDRICDLFKQIWVDEEVPKEWCESKVTLLHKGGHKNKKELKNYRPIALANNISKIFCGIVNDRLKEVIEREKVMSEEQNGFRQDRRGEDNIYIVNELIESFKKSGKKVFFAFIDIEKAYDRVDREILCDVLVNCGVTEKIVKIVRSLYRNTKAKYRLGNIESD